MKKYLFCMLSAILFCVAVSMCRASLSVSAVNLEENSVVVLDAGHGGMDGGVVGVLSKEKEKDINLKIVNFLKTQLENAGLKVVLTRKTDGGLYGLPTKGFKKRDMQKRKETVEKSGACLMVSVHQNFYPSSSSRGGQVFFSENLFGKEVAKSIQEELNTFYEGYGVKPRQEKIGDYYMLNCTSVPSVIVECGFLSNPLDDKILSSPVGQNALAERIVSGIMKFLGEKSLSKVENFR